MAKQAKAIVAFDFLGTVADWMDDSPVDARGRKVALAVPGMAELFAELKSAGYQPYVISGGDESEGLEAIPVLGIEWKDTSFHERYKDEAIDGLKRHTNVVAYVGDSGRDVEGPASIGVPVVVFNWKLADNPEGNERLRNFLTEDSDGTGAKIAMGFDELRIALMELGIDLSGLIANNRSELAFEDVLEEGESLGDFVNVLGTPEDWEMVKVLKPGRPDDDRVLIRVHAKSQVASLIAGNPFNIEVLGGSGILHKADIKTGEVSAIELSRGSEQSINPGTTYWYESVGEVPLIIRDTGTDFQYWQEPSAQEVVKAVQGVMLPGLGL
jgi:hypothetical protein